jgi:hypothetical protein
MSYVVGSKTLERCCSLDWYAIQYPEAMTRVMTKRKATISQPLMIPHEDNPLAIAEAMLWCEYYKTFIPAGVECMEPLSNWFYPILDIVDRIELSNEASLPDDLEVKSMIAVEFYWRHYFEDILPEGSNGIIVVVGNSCIDDSFTYQLDGPKAIYLGVGDRHDQSYNYLHSESIMSQLTSFREGMSDYTGVALDDEECYFLFAVYPSDVMKSRKYW